MTNESAQNQILDLAVAHAQLAYRLNQTRTQLTNAVDQIPDEHLRTTIRTIIAKHL